MENAEYSDIVGNPAAPFLNSLVQQYGVATNYTGVTHPSMPNYLALTGGNTLFTTNCDDCRADAPNIADTLEAAGRTWAGYMDGMTGSCGLVSAGTYAARHNPFVHYNDIANNPARCARVQPFTSFWNDLGSGSLADFVWITPDLCHDMHDCGVASGDAWLQSVVPSIVQSPAFANAVLFIVWDEGTTQTGGGGVVPLITVSRRTPAGMQFSAPANHYDLLRTIEDVWGLTPLGQSASARPLTDFFNLLQAPGFEEYSSPSLGPPGWIADPGRGVAGFAESHQPRSGARNGVCWTPSTADCGIYQTIRVPRTGRFRASFFANAERTGGLVGVNVNGALAGSAPVQVRGFGNYGAPYTVDFSASAGDTVIAWMYSPPSPGYVVMDDVSLVAVAPPPADSSPTPGPGGWTSQDVGSVGVTGNTSASNGVWTVSGAGGAAIWGTADAFRFVHQPLAGDGQVTARVDSVQATTAFAKAGVMLRDGVGAGAAHVVLDVRPTGDVEFMQRSAAGGATVFLATAHAPAPSWVRLSRSGATVTGSVSSDGVNWIVVGVASTAFPSSVEAGLAVTSNDSSQLNASRFESVSVLPSPWTSQDIGAVGLPGSAAFDGSAWSVGGGGPAGIWGAADALQFVYRTLTGDGQIVARVVIVQNTSTFAKAGVMMRDGLAPAAANVVLDIRPTSDVEFMQRRTAGGATTFLGTATAPPPSWVRLVRSGATVSAAVSRDGATWTTVGSTTVTMATTIQVGLVVSSVNASQLNNAVFDNVAVR